MFGVLPAISRVGGGGILKWPDEPKRNVFLAQLGDQNLAVTDKLSATSRDGISEGQDGRRLVGKS